MLQFCFCGGYEGQLRPDRPRVYVTIFGACEVKLASMATLASAHERSGRPDGPRRGSYFITFCGGSEVKRITLAEEYCDLLQALRSGAISDPSWEALVTDAYSHSVQNIGSFTLFGGFDISELPTENEELDRLALSHSLGQIADTPRKILMLAIGQDGVQRASSVCQAVSVALAQSR
ncbi:MAG: hypothetical protein HRU75_07895 [Planctomycetia bacterium]|nr:MAG: hypothetical protein HRU75_07895 [Planctomycetia bacterium]